MKNNADYVCLLNDSPNTEEKVKVVEKLIGERITDRLYEMARRGMIQWQEVNQNAIQELCRQELMQFEMEEDYRVGMWHQLTDNKTGHQKIMITLNKIIKRRESMVTDFIRRMIDEDEIQITDVTIDHGRDAQAITVREQFGPMVFHPDLVGQARIRPPRIQEWLEERRV